MLFIMVENNWINIIYYCFDHDLWLTIQVSTITSKSAFDIDEAWSVTKDQIGYNNSIDSDVSPRLVGNWKKPSSLEDTEVTEKDFTN